MTPLKIYLAARFSRHEELNRYASELRDAGHEVTARWLSRESQANENTVAVQNCNGEVPLAGRPLAQEDFEDIKRADVVISITEQPRVQHTTRGGRHVELGLALGWGKQLIIIGPRENVFHTLPQVEQFYEWNDNVLDAIGNALPIPTDV